MMRICMIVNEVLKQNKVLHGASFELRTMFSGKRGNDYTFSVELHSYERFLSLGRFKVDWRQIDFWLNSRSLWDVRPYQLQLAM